MTINICKYLLHLNMVFLNLSISSSDAHISAPAPEPHSSERFDSETGTATPIKLLILHYTVATLERTIDIFTGDKTTVASHYTISEDGRIFDHVPEERAARHAGVSYWRKLTGLNKYSVGIEHVNMGYKEHEEQPSGIVIDGDTRQWYPFEQQQIDSSIILCKQIIKKHGIEPENILGHSDVAPGRKSDPGPLFPWRKLYKQGIGAWPDLKEDEPHECLKKTLHEENMQEWMITHLNIWGYKLPDDSTSAQDIIRSFQMHFRPHDISGRADLECALILGSLINKYMLKDIGECPCGKKLE